MMKLICTITLITYFLISCNHKEYSIEEKKDQALTEISDDRKEKYSDWNNYIDSTNNFLISYPNDWTYQEHPDISFLAVRNESTDSFQDNFHILIHPYNEDIQLKSFAYDFIASQERQLPEAQMRDLDEGTINNDQGVDSYYTAYITKIDTNDIFCYNVFLNLEKNIYQLNFYCKLTDRSEDVILFDRIVSSFVKY